MHTAAPIVTNPEGHSIERRHYDTQPSSPSFNWKPSIRVVSPVDHSQDREVGTTKVIKHFMIVKPKIDRVPKIHPRQGQN